MVISARSWTFSGASILTNQGSRNTRNLNSLPTGRVTLFYCFRHLLTASADGKLLLWDGLTKNKLHMVNLNGPWVVTCAISPSGRVAAAGGFDNNCALYRYLFNLKQEGQLKDKGRFPKTPGFESQTRINQMLTILRIQMMQKSSLISLVYYYPQVFQRTRTLFPGWFRSCPTRNTSAG